MFVCAASSRAESAAAVLARRLRALRGERSLGQEQLAHGAGLSLRYYQTLEAGTVASPGLQPLLRLAALLGVDSGELLAGLTPDEPGPARGPRR
jgi:transcriptional regulator with XRE-family HTH domain